MACAVACTSCAAGSALHVPVSHTGDSAVRWPPVPVDGYETTDGVRHDLRGGYMVEAGDSLLFVPPGAGERPALLSARPLAVPVLVHRDSVRSVRARLENAAPDPAGALLGGAILLLVVGTVLWSVGAIPWLIYAGSS